MWPPTMHTKHTSVAWPSISMLWSIERAVPMPDVLEAMTQTAPMQLGMHDIPANVFAFAREQERCMRRTTPSMLPAPLALSWKKHQLIRH